MEPESRESQSIHPNKLKNLATRLFPALWGYIAFTWLVTGITFSEIENGRTKDDLRNDFYKSNSLISKIYRTPLYLASKPGMELGFYLMDK